MSDVSRLLFLILLIWPLAAAGWSRATRPDFVARTLVLGFLFLALVVWAGPAASGSWGWRGGVAGGVPLEWQFVATHAGLTWIATLAVLAAVIFSGAGELSRRIGPPDARTWIVIGAVTWLAAAANPFTQLVCWELCAFALWLYLRSPSDAELVQRSAGRMLLTGLLMDGFLVGGAVAAGVLFEQRGEPGMEAAWNSVLLLQGVGWLISGLGRAALPPAVGWPQGLVALDRSVSVPFWWLGVVPAAGVAFTRAGQILPAHPPLYESLSLLTLAVSALAVTSAAARAGASRMVCIPTIAAALVAMTSLQFHGRLPVVAVYVVSFFMAIRLPQVGVQGAPHHASAIMRLAARDWAIPDVWRIFVDLPLRGSSQVLRFLDGLVFEQFGRRTSRRLNELLARIGLSQRGDPIWLPAIALLAAVVVLMVTRRG